MTDPRTIEIGGRRLGWLTTGDGPPLVLLNGYSAAAADWEPTFVEALGRSCTVIRPDHRGLGASVPAGDEPLTIYGMARDVEHVLDAIGIERATVAGWSMGGFVAQALACRAPERVRALGLLATDPGGPEAVRATPELWARLLDHSGTPRARASRLIPLLFPPALAPTVDEHFGEMIAGSLAMIPTATLDAQARAMAAWHDQPAPAPGPRVPRTIVATGTEDVVIPPANAELLAARWPGSRVERFVGTAHAFMAQEPVRLADLIVGLATTT